MRQSFPKLSTLSRFPIVVRAFLRLAETLSNEGTARKAQIVRHSQQKSLIAGNRSWYDDTCFKGLSMNGPGRASGTGLGQLTEEYP